MIHISLTWSALQAAWMLVAAVELFWLFFWRFLALLLILPALEDDNLIKESTPITDGSGAIVGLSIEDASLTVEK